jgi:diguanylate cyclase (GGDEF)-like protein
VPANRVARAATLSGLAWLILYEVSVVAGFSLGALDDRGVHDVLLVLGSILCFSGALRHEGPERVAWLLLGAGVTSWTAGEIYYTAVMWTDPSPPVPSPADVGYLLFPVLAVAGFVKLARVHQGSERTSLAVRVDGVIAALAVGALCSALVLEAVGNAGAVALSYPLTDLVLLGVLVGTLTRRHWAVDRTWLLLIAGVVMFFLADSLYTVALANAAINPGDYFDVGWWAGLFAIGVAAHQRRADTSTGRSSDTIMLVAPMLTGTVGIGVLVVSSVYRLNLLAVVLASLALVGVMLRLVLTFRQSTAAVRTSRSEALTDALTGLGNRRGLERALIRTLADDAPERWVLGLFDLNGFKTYNDTFGHPAGDALLVRLGMRLAEEVTQPGRAFRMGGDEFCVLMPVAESDVDEELERLRELLFERAEGFDVTSAAGFVRLGGAVRDASTALRIADQRMYAEKAGGRLSAPRQSAEVLKRALAEHGGEIPSAVEEAGPLAAAIARRLGLPPAEVQDVRLGMELRDVGLIAVPDHILAEPGPLTEEQWAVLRRHTLLGERIIAAAPALQSVAKLVRSSHEHYDGSGYPDGLSGEQIPRGARIIAAVDAFDAQLRRRPHQDPRTPSEAVAELNSPEFDPVVVAALVDVVGDLELSGWAQLAATH